MRNYGWPAAVFVLALFVTLLGGTGCKVPPKAPSDLSGLTVFLYRQWGNTDPTVMESGVTKLHDFLAPLAANAPAAATLRKHRIMFSTLTRGLTSSS